jgi:hypothetical protein
MQHVNVGRIISQEIITCSQKKEGMLYFPCLISGLCKTQLVPHEEKDEMLKPTGGFDAKAIETLIKGNTGRKPRLQLSAAEAKVPTTTASSPEVMVELSKMRKDAQIFYGWHNKFTSWLETQLLYCLHVDKKFVFMPLFPMELLPEDDHFEDLQPEQPTTDKAEPSAKGEKRKKKKSKSGKKKKAEKKKVEEKEVLEEHHVNFEAKQQSPIVGSQQCLPEVDQHSEAQESTDKPESSQEVLQDVAVEEEEVQKSNDDEGSEKTIAEEDLLFEKDPNEEEKVSEEKDVNEEGPEGQGHKTDEQITTDTPV